MARTLRLIVAYNPPATDTPPGSRPRARIK